MAIACGAALAAAFTTRERVSAAPAGVVHDADLQSVIPTDQISIAWTSPTTREFRYTHIITNFGDGPLEVRPEYDPATDTARGFQRIYTHDAAGGWSIVDEVPVVGTFVYHPEHGHYHFPLAQFGLYQVAPDGSVGAAVSISPKIGFCIGDSLVMDDSLPHVGVFGYFDSCAPTTMKGISVGWGDLYDRNDAGQSIDATNVPDGTYWLHTIVDPYNYFVESNKSNNITDVKVEIVNDTVRVVGAPVHPDSTPPSVTLTAPATGAIHGTVTLTAEASAQSGVVSVQFLLDGSPIGDPVAGGPSFSLSWDSTSTLDGLHYLSAQALSGKGLYGTAPAVPVNVSNVAGPPPSGSLAVDSVVSVDAPGGSAVTPPFSTTAAGDLLVAFVSSDGPPASGAQSVTVSGAGLTWTLMRRANTSWGTSEIWRAVASSVLANATVTSTPAAGGFHHSLTVAAFRGALGPGAVSAASGAGSAPSVSLTTTAAGSLLYAVGNDWDAAIGRTLPSNQSLVHQWVDTQVGDTFWVQRQTAASSGSGVLTTLNATRPTEDQWNLAAIEIVPAGSTSTALSITDVLVTNRTTSSATVTWATNLAASSRVDYGLDTTYGASVEDGGLVTSHSLDLSGLTASTTYHYKITSRDSSGQEATAGDFVFTTAAQSSLSCSITSPTAGATVSGIVSVTADATGSASISGVQFQLDGNDLGEEDLLLPYATTWDTTAAADGAHVLTAIARDPTGNRVTSNPVSVTVHNAVPPTAAGLVAAYSFNQGSGTTVPDASGNGNTGSLQNVAWTASGRYGAALSFNGSGWVTIADAALLDLTQGMTIEAWIRPSANQRSAWRSVVLKERTKGLCYSLYANSRFRAPTVTVNTGARDVDAAGATAVPVNDWTHLAGTFDGSTLRLYVNGVQVTAQPLTGALVTSTGPLRIGGNAVWGEQFNGVIDEVRIYNRALSPAEIGADMITPVPD